MVRPWFQPVMECLTMKDLLRILCAAERGEIVGAIIGVAMLFALTFAGLGLGEGM